MSTIFSPLGERLVKAQLKLESGQIANMRTHRIPDHARIHTRILGEDRTLCGRPLRNHGHWAWQFIHRGRYGESLPSGSHPQDRDACSQCVKSPVITETLDAQNARVKALTSLRP